MFIFILFMLLIEAWTQSAMSVYRLERLSQHSWHALSFFPMILLILTWTHFVNISQTFLRWSTRRGIDRIDSANRLRTSEW